MGQYSLVKVLNAKAFRVCLFVSAPLTACSFFLSKDFARFVGDLLHEMLSSS